MALFYARKSMAANQGPLKVQAQTVKNEGKENIYILGIDDDMPMSSLSLFAYNLICISPGVEVDLSTSPYINQIHYSCPDKDVCIHSDNSEIVVGLVSSDICDRWTSDKNHPWNGAPIAPGFFTKASMAPTGTLPITSGSTGAVRITASTGGPVRLTLPAGNNMSNFIGSSSIFEGATLHIPASDKIEHNCTCTSNTLFNRGCVCGFVKKKNWGLQ
jgi:hypothetical protein